MGVRISFCYCFDVICHGSHPPVFQTEELDLIMHTLQAISAFLSKKTSIFIILVAVFTFFYRETFSWVRNDIQTIILGLIMLTMGMSLTKKDFENLLAKPKHILLGTLAQFTVMPLIAYGLTHLLHLPLAIGLGLLWLAAVRAVYPATLCRISARETLPFRLA